jgi:hypothetical protein
LTNKESDWLRPGDRAVSGNCVLRGAKHSKDKVVAPEEEEDKEDKEEEDKED